MASDALVTTELRGVPAGGQRTDTGQVSEEDQVDTGDDWEADFNPPELLAFESFSEESMSESELCQEAEVTVGEEEEAEVAVEEEEDGIETEELPAVVEGLRKSTRSTAGKHTNPYRLPRSVRPNHEASV